MINRKTVGGVVFAVLLTLLFFSRTIYAYNLPEVTATIPERGALKKMEIASGVAVWRNTEPLYAAVAGHIEEVLAKEGEKVRKGQELLKLSFDPAEAERQLREIGNRRSGTALDLQDIDLRIDAVQRNIQRLEEADYTPDAVTSYELDQVTLDIRRARQKLYDLRDGYNYDGDETLDRAIDDANLELQKLYLQQEALAQKLEKEREDTVKQEEESERDREKQLADYAADLEKLELERKAQNLKLSAYSLEEEPYRRALADFEAHAVILAPTDGIVTKLEVRHGEAVTADQLLAEVGAEGSLEVECKLPVTNNFVSVGDKCTLTNPNYRLEGTVSRIVPEEEHKTVTVLVETDKTTAGETFDIRFEKESGTTYTLVPTSALNKDNTGYFLYQIKRRAGILGDEYYVDRLSVYIGDADTTNTAIVQGLSFFEPVVLLSDKGLSVGSTVTVQNEGDFFES